MRPSQAAGKPLPGHVELLTLLSRAARWRNFQTLNAHRPSEEVQGFLRAWRAGMR